MPLSTPDLTDKQIASEMIGQMPESVSLEEISEELAILAAIHESQAAAAGQLVSHEEVKRRLAALILKSVKPDVPVILEKARENGDGSISQCTESKSRLGLH